MTSSCHRCLGLPTGLVPIGFQSNSLLAGLVWSILCIWPQPFDSLCLNESHYICTFYQFVNLHVVSYSPCFINIISSGHTINKIQISILSGSVYLQRCDNIWFHVPDNSSCPCEVLRPCRSMSSECDIKILFTFECTLH
jgi:hypothetical protein